MVTTRWVEACLEAGWCQEEAAHGLDAGALADEGAGQSGGGPPLLAASAGGSLAAARRPAASLALLDEATTLSDSLVPAPSIGAGVPPTAADGWGGPAAAPAPMLRGPSRLQRGGSAADVVTAAAAAADPLQQQQQQQQQQAVAQPAAAASQAALDEQLAWDDATPTYLDAVRLRLLGCSAGETEEALGLVRRGAAKRYADWRDDLNHLVVSCRWAGRVGNRAARQRASTRQAPCRRGPTPRQPPPRVPPHATHTAGGLRAGPRRGRGCARLSVGAPRLRGRRPGLAAPGGWMWGARGRALLL